jgi:hypothetical protein
LNIYEKEISHNDYFDEIKDSYMRMKKVGEAKQKIDRDRSFREIIENSLNEKEIKLSEIIAKNKYTLLDVWASW